ncbi:unnamed protein product [Chrysoparadoxa australica]
MIRRREDERFSTPRATLGSSTASDSSEWGTPRERWSAYSDRESISPKPEQNMAPTPAPLHGGVGGSSSPFMAPAPAPLHGGAGNHSPFYTADVESVFSLARHNRYQDVERLLEKGVPVNVLDEYGNSILAVACQNGHKRVAKAALRRGAGEFPAIALQSNHQG